MSASNKNPYAEKGDNTIVEDEYFRRVEEHAEEPYEPEPDDPAMSTGAGHKYNLRHAKPLAGHYYDDETSGAFEKVDKELSGPEGKDIDRRVASYVARSHAHGRTVEAKRESAEKASEIYQEVTGVPLEINEKGEVVTDKP